MLTRWIYAYFKVVFAYPAKTQARPQWCQSEEARFDAHVPMVVPRSRHTGQSNGMSKGWITPVSPLLAKGGI